MDDSSAVMIVEKKAGSMGSIVIRMGGGGLGLALTPKRPVIDPQDSVLSRFDPTPGTPVGALIGDRYISLASANDWLINNIYEWNGAWVETVISEGVSAWVEDEGGYYFFTGAAWVDAGGTIDHEDLLNVTSDLHHPKLHAADHIVVDPIQEATSAQKGLATAAQIKELEQLSIIADTLHVDGNRVDTYTEDGSRSRPYKNFTAAIAAAVALTPAADNKIAVVSKGAATHTEDLTFPSFVRVIALATTIIGAHTIADDAHLHVGKLEASGTQVAISKTAGAGNACVIVEDMLLTGTAAGFLCTSGHIDIQCDELVVENGFGVGQVSTARLHAIINRLHITGTGVGVGLAAAGILSVRANYIYDDGAGKGIYAFGGGAVDATVTNIDCKDAYIVDGTSELRLLVGSLTGTETSSGLALVTKAGILPINEYRQNAKPTLSALEKLAIWVDTDNADRSYLVFWRGAGDQGAFEFGF